MACSVSFLEGSITSDLGFGNTSHSLQFALCSFALGVSHRFESK